jgi:hypothetical protein
VRRRLAALGVALAVVALAAGAVFAASKVVPNDGVFHACYDSGGNVKFIDYSATQTCPKGWTGPVTWNQSGLIGIHTVYFIGNDFALGGPGSTILRVWMETGSPSEACLATMGEANHAPTVQTLYCSSRLVTLADGEQHWGVALTLFLDGALEDNPTQAEEILVPAWYSINVYQEGATFWGDPIRCDLDGC